MSLTVKIEGIEIPLGKGGYFYGIDNLKNIAVQIGKLWRKLKERLEDGKFTWVEALMTGVELTGATREVLSSLKMVVEELKDLSQDEIEQLVLFLSRELSISPMSAQEFVEGVLIGSIEVAFGAIKVYQNAKNIL